MIHTRRALIAVAAAVALAAPLVPGCAKTETTLPPPPPAAATTQPTLAASITERVQEIRTRAAEYASLANLKSLPRSNEVEDRAANAQAFDLLSQIIPLLSGPDMPGDLAQQLRIIDSTRSQLANGSQDLSVEPTTDAGLRAAYRALNSVGQRSFADADDVKKSLDAMRGRVEELDTATGPIHRLVAAQVLAASSEAVSQMAANLEARLIDKDAPKAPAAPAGEKPGTPAGDKPAAPAGEAPKPAETPAAPAAPAAPAPSASGTETPKPATPAPDLNK